MVLKKISYIDDIVYGVTSLLEKPAEPKENWDKVFDASRSSSPYAIYNIGNNDPVKLGKFISIIEDILDMKARKEFHDMQPGDIKETFANIDELSDLVGYKPRTSLEEGLKKFIYWYKDYYHIK